jgi:hypothetical protein
MEPSPRAIYERMATSVITGAIVGAACSCLALFFWQSWWTLLAGACLGSICSVLWPYMPFRYRSGLVRLGTFAVVALFVCYIAALYLSILIAFWNGLLWVGDHLFGLGTPARRVYHLVVASFIVWILIQIIRSSIWGDTVSVGDDHYPVALEEADASIHSGLQEEWNKLKAKLQPGDEIWFWRTHPWTWRMLAGRCGYMIVRRGRTTRHWIITGMN